MTLSGFAGISMTDFVRAAFVDGDKVFDHRRVTIESGAGQFVWATVS
jgi:hypothetical protein